MSVFVSNNANGRNVSFSSFESSIVDDTQIRTKKKTHQCGGGLNQNNLQNRRNFFCASLANGGKRKASAKCELRASGREKK